MASLVSPTAREAESTAPPSFESHFNEYYQPRTRDFQPQPAPETASLRDGDNQSLLPPYTEARYGKYGSEAEYLAALRRWVEAKSCERPGDSDPLFGFYGQKTMNDYANQDGPGLSFRRNRKEKKWGSVSEERPARNEATEEQAQGQGQQRRRKSSISQWLNRRRTGSITG